MRKILTTNFQESLRQLDAGEELIEIAKEEKLENIVEKIYWLALKPRSEK